MTASTRSAVSMLTDFFASDDIEAAARRTGFVKRTAKLTGKLFLSLVTFGVWSEAKTTLAQLAAKVTQLEEQLEVSPEAIHQRMNKRALAFLQDMICQALAKVQSLEKVCEDGLFTYFTKVYLVDSTGFGLPESLQDLFPGAGGSAAKAGAKIQAVWDYKSIVFGHFALTPWNIPDNKYVDTVVALAQKGMLFLCDLGYFKVKAFAHLAAAGAYFLSRLNHQTNLYETIEGRLTPLELTCWLQTVKGTIVEKDIFMGANELVLSRLIAVRVPEAVVNERRRIAKKNAKKKAILPHKYIWNCWLGTSLLPMCHIQCGILPPSIRHIPFVGK